MGTGSGGLALRGGHALSQNLSNLKQKFHLSKSGFFGTPGKGRGRTRNISSSNPARTAQEFANLAAAQAARITTIAGKGLIYTMRDGSVITHRYYSSSKDRTPVVELNVHKLPDVKSQKIHFTKKGGK